MDGHWACGASGHVEAAESVVETALRETCEELGVRATAEDLIPLTAMHRTNDLGGAALEQRVDLFFTLRAWEGTPAVREPSKNAGLRWFPLTDPPDPVPPHERYVLTLLAGALDGERPVPSITTVGPPPPPPRPRPPPPPPPADAAGLGGMGGRRRGEEIQGTPSAASRSGSGRGATRADAAPPCAQPGPTYHRSYDNCSKRVLRVVGMGLCGAFLVGVSGYVVVRDPTRSYVKPRGRTPSARGRT